MSSRALRKLQREEEERKQLALLEKEENVEEVEESEEDDINQSRSTPLRLQKNAFDFLNAADEDDEDDQEAEESSHAGGSDEDKSTHVAKTTTSSARKRKKAKKKKKKDAPPEKSQEPSSKQNQLDEIDLALKSLDTKGKGNSQEVVESTPNPRLSIFYGAISTDTKHLNALNEMKKLFGSTVVESERDVGGAGRRRGRWPIQIDLVVALSGRNSVVSRGK